MDSSVVGTVKYLKVFTDWKAVLLPMIMLILYVFSNNVVYFVINFVANDVGISFGVNMVVFGLAGSLGCLPLSKHAYNKSGIATKYLGLKVFYLLLCYRFY